MAMDENDPKANEVDEELEAHVVYTTPGSRRLAERLGHYHGIDPTLSGGDVDARWEDAESGGDETVGGSTAVPGQNDVDEIGAALGVTYRAGEELNVGEKEAARDKHRWELDPASSEDYQERTKPQAADT